MQELRRTGGGPAPVLNLEEWQSKVLQTIPVCSVEGVKDGTDTFVENNLDAGQEKIAALPVGGMTDCNNSCNTETRKRGMCASTSKGETENKKARCEKKSVETLVEE